MKLGTAQPETLTEQLARLTSRPCPECNGVRTVTRMEAKWWGGSQNGVALTGYKVPKCYVCETCSGKGTVTA